MDGLAVQMCILEIANLDPESRENRLTHEAVFRCAAFYVAKGLGLRDAVLQACQVLGVQLTGPTDSK